MSSQVVSEARIRECIRSTHPSLETDDPDRFSTLWEEMVAASKEPSFTAAAARLVGEDPMLVILLSWERKWRTTEDEAIVLSAFMPRVTNLISKTLEKDGSYGQEVIEAIERCGKHLVDEMVSKMKNREQKADMD